MGSTDGSVISGSDGSELVSTSDVDCSVSGSVGDCGSDVGSSTRG